MRGEQRKNRCVFLDRDGVINRDVLNYTWRTEDFEILEGVPEALKLLKSAGYLLIVVTNQGGIGKGLYTRDDVFRCHEVLQRACGGLIDALYYAPGHPSVSASLSRKPDSLLFEKAIAKYNIDPAHSWMIGDRERDIVPALKLGMRTIQLTEGADRMVSELRAGSLYEAAGEIVRGLEPLA